jgi:RNA polymerase sigma-70 factor (ECF subfamily)
MDKLFRQWTRDHQDQAWSLACYLLRDRAEAEDAVQEAFERLWERRESMSAARVKPWLLRVTRNLCLDRLRQRRPEEEPDDTALADPRGPAEALQRAQLQAQLKAAVQSLEEPFRSLVVLRDIQQHSYEEVAAMTELSLPQVKTYLHRARRKLRDQLSEWRA